MVESRSGVYDPDHVNLWLTGINSVFGLNNDQVNISYCRNNLIHDNVYDGANPALRPDGPDYDCIDYILFFAGAGSGGTMENIRVYNNTFRNQKNDETSTIGFTSRFGAHAEDVSIYANTIQDIRAGRFGIYAETPPFLMGSSKDISIVNNTFSSDKTTEIFNGILAAWMSHTLIARNNYKNGNYLSYETVISDPVLDMSRMPVFLAFCENCIVNEVGGFPPGESGEALNWIVDIEGINNRIIGLAATPKEVPPGIGAVLSNQKKAQIDLLKHMR